MRLKGGIWLSGYLKWLDYLISGVFRSLHWICIRTPPKVNVAKGTDQCPTDKRKRCDTGLRLQRIGTMGGVGRGASAASLSLEDAFGARMLADSFLVPETRVRICQRRKKANT